VVIGTIILRGGGQVSESVVIGFVIKTETGEIRVSVLLVSDPELDKRLFS
jgi:hypothetical protein